MAKIKFEKSCGNVFEDLGLPNAEERLLEADKRIIISQIQRCSSSEELKSQIKKIYDISIGKEEN